MRSTADNRHPETLAAVQTSYLPLLHTVLATGLRWSEAEALCIGDLNLLRNEIVVRESKTEAGKRAITITDEDVEILAAHLAATGRTGGSPESPLFTSPGGRKLHYSNFMRRVFQPTCKSAGLIGVTFHDLRRTHATMLIDAGMNAKVVQQRMGHTRIETTLSLYASASEQGRKQAAEAMSQYLHPAAESALSAAT